MLATEGDAEFDPEHRMECHFSSIDHSGYPLSMIMQGKKRRV